jgi:hypothetical protein
MYVDKAT